MEHTFNTQNETTETAVDSNDGKTLFGQIVVYGAIAAAVVGAGYGLYKLVSKESKAEEPTEEATVVEAEIVDEPKTDNAE